MAFAPLLDRYSCKRYPLPFAHVRGSGYVLRNLLKSPTKFLFENMENMEFSVIDFDGDKKADKVSISSAYLLDEGGKPDCISIVFIENPTILGDTSIWSATVFSTEEGWNWLFYQEADTF